MKICLITLFTPTSENRKGPSALIYFLIRNRRPDINISVFTFNINDILPEEIKNIENELNIIIHVLPQPLWYRFITSPHHKMTFLRILLKLPLCSYIRVTKKICKKIKAETPDLFWWYTSDIFRVPKPLRDYNHIVSGPDSLSLDPFRLLRVPSIYNSPVKFWGHCKLLYGALKLERQYQTHKTLMHVVGLEDLHLLREINPNVNAIFLLHPHYHLASHISINFNKPKLRLLLAGKRYRVNEQDTLEFVKVLCKHSDKLSSKYSITFLGKGWDEEVKTLMKAGYDCVALHWVDNYIETISQYDIQVTLISSGAGTKGKVLDAFANGLLVIGSDISLENIAVRHNDSCLRYRRVEDIAVMLSSIYCNPKRYEAIAYKGMNQVRIYHSPQRISMRFFALIEKFHNENQHTT